MGLNIVRGNMYPWITHTWNTIKGECPHGCSYCYMHRWGKQKPVRFDEKELKTDLGRGNFIFVGSSCDMFAENINPDWIYRTLYYCDSFENQYLFQTKNPGRYIDYEDHCTKRGWIVCTTLETNRKYPQMGNTLLPGSRAFDMAMLLIRRFVTIEPIMDFDLYDFVEIIKKCSPEQVNIGADSGNNHLPEPPKEKIYDLIAELEKFTKVEQKANLKRLLR